MRRTGGSYSQNCTMETPRCAISEWHFGKFPDPDDFQCWRVNFKTKKCVSASTPELIMSWILEVEMAGSMDDLTTSQSTEGESFPDLEMLDAKIASALRKIISRTSFRRRVSVEEQQARKYNRFLRERQIAYMIFGHIQSTGAYDTAQGVSDLFSICLQDDDVQDFETTWDQILFGTSEMPPENVLEDLYGNRLQGSEQIQTVFEMYNQELSRDHVAPRCQKNLKRMARQHTDQTIRTRSFKARNERIETGVWVKSQKGKTSTRKEKWDNAFNGRRPDSVQKKILVVLTTGLILVNEHNHPLLLQKVD